MIDLADLRLMPLLPLLLLVAFVASRALGWGLNNSLKQALSQPEHWADTGTDTRVTRLSIVSQVGERKSQSIVKQQLGVVRWTSAPKMWRKLLQPVSNCPETHVIEIGWQISGCEMLRSL